MRASGGIFLVLAWGALGGRALADEPTPAPDEPGSADLETAARHVQALEYPEAINVLEALLRRGSARPSVVTRVYELLAAASASSGEEAHAVWAYQRLLALSPGWQPPTDLSPRLAGALERARTELPTGARLSVGLQRPRTAAAGRPLSVTLVADPDALGLVRGARVYHRPAGGRRYSQVTVRGAAPVEVVVPASATGQGGAIDLWAAALDEHGNEVVWVGRADAPSRVPLGALPSSGRRRSPPGSPEEGSTWGLFGQWWFWTGAIALVAGATVLAVIVTRPEPDCPAQRACFDVRVESGGTP